jgi:anti-sigma factor RsiW
VNADVHALSGAYALDAVDDLERVAFERHLAECAVCRQEVRELRETTTRLVDEVAVAPPPGMRGAVLGAVARTPQLRSTSPDRASRAPADRWRRRALAAVAAAVIAVGAGVGTWSVADDRVQRERQVAAAERERAREIEQVLAAADVRVLKEDVTGGGTVNVAVAPSRDAAVAVLSGLLTLGRGQVYQLWLIRGNDIGSLGVLKPGQTAATTLVRGVGPSGEFGVSIEQGPNGAAAPTRIVKRMNLR